MTDDERLYLQFLQNNIARMNTNSAQAKGWCIAIIAALLAIFADTKNSLFLLICIVSWMLYICNRNINSLECTMIMLKVKKTNQMYMKCQ